MSVWILQETNLGKCIWDIQDMDKNDKLKEKIESFLIAAKHNAVRTNYIIKIWSYSAEIQGQNWKGNDNRIQKTGTKE